MKRDFSFTKVWDSISAIDQIDDLWKIKVDGSLVWPLIREELATNWFFYGFGINSNKHKALSRSSDKAKILLFSTIMNLQTRVLSLRHGLRQRKPHKVLCVAYDHIRRDKSPDGKLMDVYIDYLLPAISHHSPVVFNNWTSKSLTGKFFWPLNLGDRWHLFRHALRKLNPKRYLPLQDEAGKAVKAIDKIFEGNRVSDLIPEEVIDLIRPIENLVTYFVLDKRFYLKILETMGVRVLVITGHSKFAWQEAAREMGVTSIILQQGLMSRISVANNVHAAARKYKKEAPFQTIMTVNGQYFTDELSSDGFWDQREIVPIGFARFARALQDYPPVALSSKRQDPQINVLITSDHHIAEEMAEYIEKVSAALADDSSKVKWIIKQHPWKDNVQAYNNRSFKFDLIDEVKHHVSLYELLRDADLHLTSWSAVALEAIPYGVPTLFMHHNGLALMPELIRKDIALDACDPNVTVKIIRGILDSPKESLVTWQGKIREHADYFWSNNPEDRFRCLIESKL